MCAHVCIDRKWWKEAIVYQVYPRSFYDSNGDGIGDLKGITEKLDYIKSLGVDVIWLNPVYDSPNDDNGYDIRNYFEIMREFGSMNDWEELLNEMHGRGLRLIMDLVVNHTSDEHQWFINSRSDKNSSYRDYYIWRDPVNGGRPSDWGSHFSGSAWDYDELSRQYYLHLFTKKQPDLNWENPAVREDVYTMMRWWLDKGIDGFRMDTINMLSKTPGFPSVGDMQDGKFRYAGKFFTNGPRIHEFLKEMYREVLSRYDVMSIGETPNVSPETAIEYTSPESEELDMLFQFEHMTVDQSLDNKWEEIPFDLVKFKAVIEKWQRVLHGRGWNSNYLMNHDQPRSVSRFGDEGVFRVPSAKMLLTMLLTLEGTPFIYQGEEIGMINARFTDISEYRDVEIKNHWREVLKDGGDRAKALDAYARTGRDNSRTPMQWSAKKNAGFTTGHPWIEAGRSYEDINVENDLMSEDSVIVFLRAMTSIRKENPALVYGDFRQIFPEHRNLFIYCRRLDDNEFLVILNFSAEESEIELKEIEDMRMLIGNYSDQDHEKTVIRPFEARVYNKTL